jgi:hypothetical protein
MTPLHVGDLVERPGSTSRRRGRVLAVEAHEHRRLCRVLWVDRRGTAENPTLEEEQDLQRLEE